MPRDNNIRLLRLLLAFTVMSRHLIAITGNIKVVSIEALSFLNFSVTAFFIISGMLVYGGFQANERVAEYFKRRFLRIGPAYFFVILFFSVFLFFFSRQNFSAYFFSKGFFEYLAANLSFMNFIQPCINDVFSSENHKLCAVNGSLWTMKIEVGFYIILPVLYFLFFKNKSKKIQNLWLLVFFIVSAAYYVYFNTIYVNNVLERQLPGAFRYFAVGIFFFLNYNFVKKNIVVLFIGAMTLMYSERYLVGTGIFHSVVIGLGVFFTAFVLPKFKVNDWLKKYDLSYGIYLFHFPVIQILISLGLFEKNYALATVLLLGIVLICSVFCWKFLEQPFMRLARNKA